MSVSKAKNMKWNINRVCPKQAEEENFGLKKNWPMRDNLLEVVP